MACVRACDQSGFLLRYLCVLFHGACGLWVLFHGSLSRMRVLFYAVPWSGCSDIRTWRKHPVPSVALLFLSPSTINSSVVVVRSRGLAS